MDDLNDNDISMGDLPEVTVDVPDDNQSGGERDVVGVAAKHRDAEHNYEIKTFKILTRSVPLPRLFDIYFHPERSLVPVVPQDIQLDFYFYMYNSIASDNFVAQKTQPLDISRTIWFYGVDSTHAFTMHCYQIRWNVIIMSFLWATGFDERYCKPACGPFIIKFIKAWIESLVYQHDISDNIFAQREAFIKFWKNGPFDLYYFGKRDKVKMIARIKHLYKQLETKDLPKHDDLVKALRDETLDEETFERYGPTLAFQWVIGREKYARVEQEAIDYDNQVNQSDLELAEADREVAEAKKQVELTAAALENEDEMEEDDEEEEKEDGFDPYPKENHPSLSRVGWDDVHGIVMPLMRPVDASLPHPRTVHEKHRPVADESTFYVTRDQLFDAILRIRDDEIDELGDSLATMTTMINTKLT